MNRRWFTTTLCLIGLISLLFGCGPANEPSRRPSTLTPPPTPNTEFLLVNGTSPAGARLRITLPSIRLLKRDAADDVQLVLVLAAAQTTSTYLLYPANRSGEATDQFDLTSYPLEISLPESTTGVSLWLLAVHNTRYYAAEILGLNTLASSLAAGFQHWLADGRPQGDPLAAVVSASNGALYEWFATTEVLGQDMITFKSEEGWNIGTASAQSPDGGLNVVYTVQYISAADVALLPTPTSTPEGGERPGYTLVADETFADGTSVHNWFEGGDSTYTNAITDGAYEIRLTDLQQRDFGLSWGSIEGEQFQDYIIEAQVQLVEDNVDDARYGIWFNYQDDYNFIYFGISNQGAYRVARIQSNSNRREIQDWTPSTAIHPGAATNVLTIEAGADHTFTLSANNEPLMTFRDDTFAGGSIAFFCYAKSVPAICRLERLRIWEPAS